jgi:hypothetical protein
MVPQNITSEKCNFQRRKRVINRPKNGTQTKNNKSPFQLSSRSKAFGPWSIARPRTESRITKGSVNGWRCGGVLKNKYAMKILMIGKTPFMKIPPWVAGA